MSVRRVLGAVAVVGIATALVAQALPATPVTRDARAADQPAALSAASGAAPQVVAPAGPSTSTVPALVGRLPAPALRMTAVSRARQRPMTAVSRTRQRPALPGCDGRAPASGHANGQIPVDELCALPFAPTQRLRADAAVALAGLDTAYAEVFGDDLCVSDSYRTIGAQLSLAARKPGLAARPGRSEHGWAIAVDL